MRESSYRIGLDIGSTTAKIAVLDRENKTVYSRYERHNAKVGALIEQYFDDVAQIVGTDSVSLCVTGSVGMATAEQLGATFVQEVVAATDYARE